MIALALMACDDGAEPSSKPPGPGAPEQVTYEAEDGLLVVADFYAPIEGGPAPAILLLHQFNGGRAQWAELVPDLLQWGFAVLAPDLRGFGDSTIILRDGVEEDYELRDLDDMLLDVAAAIDYLKSQDEVDPEGLGVVGASMGGNLAYVASGAFPEVEAAVSMSPDAAPQDGSLLGTDVPNFGPRAVLFMADEAEADDASTLAKDVGEPVDTIVYEGRTAHGVELLDDPKAKPDIRGWLTVNLRLSSSE